MKKIIIFLGLVAVIFSCNLNAQQTTTEKNFTEFNLPNFAVNQQITELFIIKYGGIGLTTGTFENPDGVEINKFNRKNVVSVYGYPITATATRNTQLYFGLGYTMDKFGNISTADKKDVLEETYNNLYLNGFWDQRLSGKFLLFSYLQFGVNGVKPFSNFENTNNFLLLEKINYRANRNMNLGLGVFYSSNLGTAKILPAIAFVLSGDNFLINIDFPRKAEIEGIFNYGKIRPAVGVAFPLGTYYLNDTDQYISYLGTTAYAGVQYMIFDLLYASVTYSYNLSEKYEFGSRGDLKEIGTLKNNSTLTFSLNMQIAKFIPLTRED